MGVGHLSPTGRLGGGVSAPDTTGPAGVTPLHGIADVVDAVGARAPVDLLRRRLNGTHTVDEWGLDADLLAMVDPLVGIRWDLRVEGADAIPSDGPVVLVVNRHVGVSEPFVVAQAVRRETGRIVRFLGVPDVAPVGPVLRRLGGALGRSDELSGLLRAGSAVVVALDRSMRSRRRAGFLPPGSMAPVLAQGAAVFPVAAVGRELGRRWTVIVGDEVPRPPGRSPLAVAELADAARTEVQVLLDEAFPPRWPFG